MTTLDELTRDRLTEVLNYNRETGDFVWVSKSGPSCTIGKVAGTIESYGYVSICIDKKKYKAHRLAFLYETGRWPTDQVDHIDGNRANNKWSNLREASMSNNLGNSFVPRHNRSGFKGVHWRKSSGRWRATIRKDRTEHYLGEFDDPKEAARAYDRAAIRLYASYARTNADMGLL